MRPIVSASYSSLLRLSGCKPHSSPFRLYAATIHHKQEHDPGGSREGEGAVPGDVGCIGWDGSQKAGGKDAVNHEGTGSRNTDTGLFVRRMSTPPEAGDVVSSTVTGNAGIDDGGGLPRDASYYGVADWETERADSSNEESDGVEEALSLGEEMFRRAAENGIPDTPQARALARMGRA